MRLLSCLFHLQLAVVRVTAVKVSLCAANAMLEVIPPAAKRSVIVREPILFPAASSGVTVISAFSPGA